MLHNQIQNQKIQDQERQNQINNKKMPNNQKLLFWLIVTSALFLFTWGIWSVPLLSHNEARRLVVLQEMIASHQWLIPTKNGHYYFEKPPLFYWSGIFFSLIFHSTSEWVLRLPSALAALFVTAFLYQRVKFYIGQQPALFSALILISSPLYVMYARRAEINVLFGMLCFTALVLYYDHLHRKSRSYLYLAFAVLGLACLAKGPVALVFFIPPLLIYALLRKDITVLKGLASPLAWGLFVIIGGSWFAYAYYGVPDNPLQAVIQKDIVGKVGSNERDPFYSYFSLLMANFAPWSLIIFYRPRHWFTTLKSSRELQFVLCAFLVPLLIMSFFSSHHGKYMLPLVPFYAVFLGYLLSDSYNVFRQRCGTRCGTRFENIFIALSAALLAFVFAAIVIITPYAVDYRFITLKPLAQKIHDLQSISHVPVYAYIREPIQLIYYYKAPIPVLDRLQLKQKLKQQQSFLLLVEGGKHREIPDEKGLCVLDEFSPYLKKKRKGLLYGSNKLCQ